MKLLRAILYICIWVNLSPRNLENLTGILISFPFLPLYSKLLSCNKCDFNISGFSFLLNSFTCPLLARSHAFSVVFCLQGWTVYVLIILKCLQFGFSTMNNKASSSFYEIIPDYFLAHLLYISPTPRTRQL